MGVSESNIKTGLKSVWAHVKSKNLQIPEDKRCFKTDPILKDIFKQDQVHMFEVIKLLAPHFEKSIEIPGVKVEVPKV